jgi:ATP-dependent Clp protease protease subunit
MKKEIRNEMLVPIVIERDGRGERSWDIYSRLLKDRIVFIQGEINDYAANLIIAQVLFLARENKNEDINVYINSPGGYVQSGLAILDTMQYVSCDVSTICIGQAASMGAVLLAAGEKGKRFSLPHARIMIHQPWGGMQGTASDIEIHAREIIKSKQQLCEILSQRTGKSIEQIVKDSDRDFFMDPKEAKDYGLIDEIIEASAAAAK